MKFKNLFPNYNTFITEEMNMNELNTELIRDICSIFPERITKGTMLNLCHVISRHTSSMRTTNWDEEWLAEDYFRFSENFRNKKFHNFMDFINEAVFNFSDADTTIKEINDILEEHNVGYRLTNNPDKPWVLAKKNIDFQETIASLYDISLQATEHIEQAKNQLITASNLRSRKDAIRDCLSATETVIKKISHKSSYKHAAELFIGNPEKWGHRIITTDCIKIWKLFHEDYRDIRHGDDNISDLSLEEAIYFIERILSFLNYIVKRAEIIGEINN